MASPGGPTAAIALCDPRSSRPRCRGADSGRVRPTGVPLPTCLPTGAVPAAAPTVPWSRDTSCCEKSWMLCVARTLPFRSPITLRTLTVWSSSRSSSCERAEAGKESRSTPPPKDCHRNVSKGCGFECRKDPADTAFSTLRDPFALAPISPNPTRPGRAAWVACSWYAVGGGRGSGVAPGAGSPHPWAGAVAVTRQQRAWVWRCSCCGFVAPSGRRGDARAEAR